MTAQSYGQNKCPIAPFKGNCDFKKAEQITDKNHVLYLSFL
jgi:hypothetical protein